MRESGGEIRDVCVFILGERKWSVFGVKKRPPNREE